MSKTAVVLLNMGGPDSMSAIRPFLYNLFSDHDIIQIPRLIQKPVAFFISTFRAKKTEYYYKIMGGKSPQKEQTILQAKALQEALKDDFVVEIALRYWHPFTQEAIKNLESVKPSKIVLLPLYPHYSSTTTGSSFKEFYRLLKKSSLKDTPVKEVRDYHDHPLFIKAWTENIKNSGIDDEYFILFSAHSLPQKIIDKGDPYKAQIEKSVDLIMKNFTNKHMISYQSKVGPVKWLEPATDKTIENLAKQGVKKLCLVPISFVSEHSETLYEMDYLYKNMAKDLGINHFVRVPTLQTNPVYIELLKELSVNAFAT
jgi:ferrochelatase